MDDLLHFVYVASVLFFVFAFAAHFTFGTEMEAFATLSGTFYTQCRMVIGDWPFSNQTPGIAYTTYLVAYTVIVFITLLNFLLAVVVDAYAKVTTATQDLVVEKSLLYDIYFSYKYFFYRFGSRQWPSRWDVAMAIGTIDMNDDGEADLAQAADNVPLPAQFFTGLRAPFKDRLLFADYEMAKAWVEYYVDVVPELSYFFESERENIFVFQEEEATLAKIAWLARDDTSIKMSKMLRNLVEAREVEEKLKEETQQESLKEKARIHRATMIADKSGSLSSLSPKAWLENSPGKNQPSKTEPEGSMRSESVSADQVVEFVPLNSPGRHMPKAKTPAPNASPKRVIAVVPGSSPGK
jgi:hypothetical protein